MNKLCKMASFIVVIIMVVSVSIITYAYTNNDVIAYISSAHTVNGRTMKLGESQIESLKQYLNNNPVTDSDAGNIISKLDLAKTKLQNSGATNLSQLDSSIKAEVMSLVKEAGAIAGLDVQINTKNETITIKDSAGNVIVSATSYSQLNSNPSSPSNSNGTSQDSNSSTNKKPSKLVYTGNNYSIVIIKSLVAVVAIAIIGVVIKKYYAK